MVTGKNLSLLFDNFNQLTPYAVGFDRMFNRLNDYTQHQTQSTGFPPYDIRKVNEFEYCIEMALAGFGKEDIEVEVSDGVVTIRSIKESDDSDNVIHKGISYRKFVRKFTIADDIIVNSAKLDNGLLHISLERIVPEEKKPKIITVQ